MALLGIDLGGSKLALALFSNEGEMLLKETMPLGNRQGKAAGKFITENVLVFMERAEAKNNKIISVGISVPGISHISSGTVWAPNIPGWEDYPLLKEIKEVTGAVPVIIDSDRACYILGEIWRGNAKGCRDAIFLSIGTGIGAGILVNGEILRGSNDIAGCIGWMALDRPFESKYISCGCFEYYASGEGIAKVTKSLLTEKEYSGSELSDMNKDDITSVEVFAAYEHGDPLAVKVIQQCIEFWGMAVANLVSLFNPEKIIFGGGVFGPGKQFIPDIKKEAAKWAQPVSINQVIMDGTALAGDAGVYGAGFLASKQLTGSNQSNYHNV
jgi:glucokinase